LSPNAANSKGQRQNRDAAKVRPTNDSSLRDAETSASVVYSVGTAGLYPVGN
jgi:hypothetical protein